MVTMREMLEAGVHFGHLTRFREPKMNEYIYGVNNKVNIINLEKTLPMFNSGMNFLKKVAKRGGKILFVGTKRTARDMVAEYAEKCDMPYVNHRWLGGMMTNYKTIRQSIRRMKDLKKMQEEGVTNNLTKKEGLSISRELEKLENSLGGIQDMGGLPDALFILDAGYEKIALQEANKLKIPVVAVVDTNSSPEGVDYVIPGNDDAMRAIQLYLETLTNVILTAKEEKKSLAGSEKFKEEYVEVNSDESENKEASA